MMEARKHDLLAGPISLPRLMDLEVLREIIGFFGHENHRELWADVEPIRLCHRTRNALMVFPQERSRIGVGLALVQKVKKGTPQLWMYRCQDSLWAHPTPYFTMLAEQDPMSYELEALQMSAIIHASVREYFDPQY